MRAERILPAVKNRSTARPRIPSAEVTQTPQGALQGVLNGLLELGLFALLPTLFALRSRGKGTRIRRRRLGHSPVRLDEKSVRLVVDGGTVSLPIHQRAAEIKDYSTYHTFTQ